MGNANRLKIANGVNLTYINDCKFKTTRISLIMFAPLNSNTVSQNAILPHLLTHSCNKIPTLQKISEKLEELYGASITSEVQKIGDNQALCVSAQNINNEFVPSGTDNTMDVIDLMCEMIFNPLTDAEGFKKENIAQEKRELIEEIQSEFNDKKTYALKKCIETMCKNEPFGINTVGNIENAKKINSQNTFEAWQNLLQKSHIEIIVIGSAACTSIENKFKKYFSNINRKNIFSYESSIIGKHPKITEISEKMDITQCKLVMGLRLKNAKESVNIQAMKVMNALLGGCAESKLFKNIREKQSLCYYCSSSYTKHKQIVLIESGIEKENIEKAKKGILEQLEDIKLGNFTDTELNEIKMFITQTLQKINDSQSSQTSWYAFQTFESDIKSPEDEIEKIAKITREDVIKAANGIDVDTIYVLCGKEGQK